MARSRRLSEQESEDAVTLVPIDDSGEAPNPADASQQWEEFDTFRDQAETSSAGKRIWVYRIPTDPVGNPVSGVESALLFDAPLDTYTLSEIFARVKREYMPRGLGRCLIRIQVRQDKVRGVLWQKVIPIEKGLRDDEASNNATGSAPSDNAALNAIAQMVQQQTTLIARMFERMQQAPAAPPIDPMAQTERMIAMVTGLSGVLAKGTAPAGPASNSINDMIGAIREIQKLSREMTPESGGSGDDGEGGVNLAGILAAGKPYAEMLTALIKRAPDAPAPNVRRLPPPPGTVPARPGNTTIPVNPNTAGAHAPVIQPPPINATGAQGNDPMLMKLAEGITEICNLIEAGKAEPEGIARLILDLVPDEFDEKFYAIIADEHWFMKLAALEPRVKNHKDFFSQARTFILAEFSEGEESAPAG